MPAELQVIRASEFVCLDPSEHMDFEASKNELKKLVRACRKRGLNTALMDLRGLPILSKPHFSKPEVMELVEAFHDAGFTQKQRLAILYEHDVWGIIQDFILFSKMRDLQVQAFTDFEKATHWLSSKYDHPAEAKHGAHVPIAKREVKKRSSRSSAAKIPRSSTPPRIRRTRRGR
jgi:hypothetical protein